MAARTAVHVFRKSRNTQPSTNPLSKPPKQQSIKRAFKTVIREQLRNWRKYGWIRINERRIEELGHSVGLRVRDIALVIRLQKQHTSPLWTSSSPDFLYKKKNGQKSHHRAERSKSRLRSRFPILFLAFCLQCVKMYHGCNTGQNWHRTKECDSSKAASYHHLHTVTFIGWGTWHLVGQQFSLRNQGKVPSRVCPQIFWFVEAMVHYFAKPFSLLVARRVRKPGDFLCPQSTPVQLYSELRGSFENLVRMLALIESSKAIFTFTM